MAKVYGHARRTTYPLRKRLRLFGATVSRSFLYAAGTWTLTEERARKIRTAQRRMLRAMLGQGRQVDEKKAAKVTRKAAKGAQPEAAATAAAAARQWRREKREKKRMKKKS